MNRLIIIQQKGSLGILTLNRPKALNAINADLQREIISQLELWKTDRSIKAIVINSSHARAFCAGGDIRQIASFIKEGHYDQAISIFAHNYQLFYYVSQYPKPIISIMDGITMGGGIGLGCFATHRIVTERVVMAMPEVKIALTPDAGSNFLFGKAPGYTGLRLMLTGQSFYTDDAIKVGFADYVVSSSMVNAIIEQLEKRNITDVFTSLKRERKYDPTFLQEVESIYGASDVETIIGRLRRSRLSWAQEDLKEISQACPFSLEVTYKSWHKNFSNLKDVLQHELNMNSHLVWRSDFLEGVRAVVIDKDRRPKWDKAPILSQTVDTCFVSSHQLYS